MILKNWRHYFLASVVFATSYLSACASPIQDYNELDGAWMCDRTLFIEGETVAAGGFNLLIDGQKWQTRTQLDDGSADYFGTAQYDDDAITVSFFRFENKGPVNQRHLDRQAKQQLPLSVTYRVSDVGGERLVLTTQKTKLNCQHYTSEDNQQ